MEGAPLVWRACYTSVLDAVLKNADNLVTKMYREQRQVILDLYNTLLEQAVYSMSEAFKVVLVPILDCQHAWRQTLIADPGVSQEDLTRLLVKLTMIMHNSTRSVQPLLVVSRSVSTDARALVAELTRKPAQMLAWHRTLVHLLRKVLQPTSHGQSHPDLKQRQIIFEDCETGSLVGGAESHCVSGKGGTLKMCSRVRGCGRERCGVALT